MQAHIKDAHVLEGNTFCNRSLKCTSCCCGFILQNAVCALPIKADGAVRSCLLSLFVGSSPPATPLIWCVGYVQNFRTLHNKKNLFISDLRADLYQRLWWLLGYGWGLQLWHWRVTALTCNVLFPRWPAEQPVAESQRSQIIEPANPHPWHRQWIHLLPGAGVPGPPLQLDPSVHQHHPLPPHHHLPLCSLWLWHTCQEDVLSQWQQPERGAGSRAGPAGRLGHVLHQWTDVQELCAYGVWRVFVTDVPADFLPPAEDY